MTAAFSVQITWTARRDLEEIYRYLAEHAPAHKAEELIGYVQEAVSSLSQFPLRGKCPIELMELGHRFREIGFAPYRIIYSVDEDVVHVRVIADGRRDMRTLLNQRLLNL